METKRTEQDARENPKPGDVVRCSPGTQREVCERLIAFDELAGVAYKIHTNPGIIRQVCLIRDWREECANAEVLHVAE